MFLFDVDEPSKATLFRAMRAVAMADGAETPKERALLEIAKKAMGLADPRSLEELSPLDPSADSDARLLESVGARAAERIIQAMILMAIMDGAGSKEEADLVATVADRLGVNEARVANLRQLADGRVRYMRFDLTRKGYARSELERTAKEEGLRGIYKTFGPLLGLAQDPEVARRYIKLGELPEGTVGRAYFDLITKNDLSFPGERGGLAERGLWHDMLHVIGGYTTDPLGEAEVVAFMAGFRREDPFFWLFTVALQFQVGLIISPFAPGVPDKIDPESFIRHHKRGSEVTIDLSTEWRFEEDWNADLEEVRRRYNVLPLEQVRLA